MRNIATVLLCTLAQYYYNENSYYVMDTHTHTYTHILQAWLALAPTHLKIRTCNATGYHCPIKYISNQSHVCGHKS